jgi:hypothetical protein
MKLKQSEIKLGQKARIRTYLSAPIWRVSFAKGVKHEPDNDPIDAAISARLRFNIVIVRISGIEV